MTAIITTYMRLYATNQFISGFSDSNENFYLFIGQTLPWINENSPPTPIDCVQDEESAFRTMTALKLITADDVATVVPRNTWTANTVYTQYAQTFNLFDPTLGNPPFFVVTNQLNVYKCLNNNQGGMSTIQPTGTQTNVVTLSDGYQWKYMYTINAADVLQFVTNQWIPVQTLTANDGSNQWLVQQAAIPGTIDRIDIITPGTQYVSTPTVTIVGDGTGAAAVAQISGGNVTNIIVTATGLGYTTATVTITGGGPSANGATATAAISPYAGHGADALFELGGFNALIDCQLVGNENNMFTVSNSYRQIGIIQNPILAATMAPATGTDYSQATWLTFSSISGSAFVPDEMVTGGTSGATGTVLDWNSGGLVLRLVQTTGAFIPGETVIGSVCSGVLQTITGTATGGTTSTIVFPGSASSVNGTYTGQMVRITGGTGAGQIRKITNYIGSSRTATVTPAYSPAPDSSSVFVVASIVLPAIVPFQGDILYLENRQSITRAPSQTEDVKILMSF